MAKSQKARFHVKSLENHWDSGRRVVSNESGDLHKSQCAEVEALEDERKIQAARQSLWTCFIVPEQLQGETSWCESAVSDSEKQMRQIGVSVSSGVIVVGGVAVFGLNGTMTTE